MTDFVHSRLVEPTEKSFDLFDIILLSKLYLAFILYYEF